MQLPSIGVNTTDHPLVHSPFVQNWQYGNDTPPPGTDFRITNDSEHRITNDGDNRITNT